MEKDNGCLQYYWDRAIAWYSNISSHYSIPNKSQSLLHLLYDTTPLLKHLIFGQIFGGFGEVWGILFLSFGEVSGEAWGFDFGASLRAVWWA